jgi:hypothetical protein
MNTAHALELFPPTYTIHFMPNGPRVTDTAKAIIHDIKTMSATTKARLELLALVVALAVTIGTAFKSYVLQEPRIDKLEERQAELRSQMEVMRAKASATDVAIAGIMPQLVTIQQSLAEIKADIRDLRAKSEHP